jgi:hypothetical protein
MTSPKDHPCFQAPADRNIKVWRYLDFTKYVSMLSSQNLFFSRSDLFADPYEGATSHANIRLRPAVYKDSKIPKQAFDQMAKLAEWTRQWTYINCWHMNEYESAAMWKLYAQTNEAVALQSTYEKLRYCLPEKVFVGVVHYIDYENEWLPEGNSMWPFVHKRKSFEHERELRALIQDLPQTDKGIQTGLPNQEFGCEVSIELNKLIEAVYVSPESPKWFLELVKNVTKKYDFNFEVHQSLLAKTPVY